MIDWLQLFKGCKIPGHLKCSWQLESRCQESCDVDNPLPKQYLCTNTWEY